MLKYLFPALLLVHIGCQSVPSSEKSKGESSKTLDAANSTNKLVTFERFSVLDSNTSTSDTTWFRVQYPEIENPQVSQWIQHIALGSDSLTLEEAASQFLKEHKEVYRGDQFDRAWIQDIELYITRQHRTYWGLTRLFYTYTGGAHGMFLTEYLHVDPINKVFIPSDELINVELMPELTSQAEKAFRKAESLSEDAKLDENYFFENGTFYLPSNFTFEQDSISFVYGLYEIKPYVHGETFLRLAYSDIQKHLTPKAKELLKNAVTLTPKPVQ